MRHALEPNERSVRRETAQRIARILEEVTGRSSDPDDISILLSECLLAYDEHREHSRDTMPTTAQMAQKTAQIRDHLDALTELLLDLHLNLWLDTFMADRGRSEPGLFLKLGEYYSVAAAAADYFEDLAAKGEAPTVEYADGTTVKHKRRTQTDARDRMLIPMLLGVFRARDLELKNENTELGTWNLEALDAACGAIEVLLEDQHIRAPDAGKTNQGEEHQGRLRRIVKSAWDSLPRTA